MVMYYLAVIQHTSIMDDREWSHHAKLSTVKGFYLVIRELYTTCNDIKRLAGKSFDLFIFMQQIPLLCKTRKPSMSIEVWEMNQKLHYPTCENREWCSQEIR